MEGGETSRDVSDGINLKTEPVTAQQFMGDLWEKINGIYHLIENNDSFTVCGEPVCATQDTQSVVTEIRMEGGDTSRDVSDGINLKTERVSMYAAVYVGASLTTEEESDTRFNIVLAQKARISDAKRAKQEIRSQAGQIFVKFIESEQQAADEETHYRMMLKKYKSGAAVDRALDNWAYARHETVTLYEHWTSIVKDYRPY